MRVLCACVCLRAGESERASERKSDGERRERESVSWNTVIRESVSWNTVIKRGFVATARHSPASQNILWNQVSDPRHILGKEETGSERTPILPGYKRVSVLCSIISLLPSHCPERKKNLFLFLT